MSSMQAVSGAGGQIMGAMAAGSGGASLPWTGAATRGRAAARAGVERDRAAEAAAEAGTTWRRLRPALLLLAAALVGVSIALPLWGMTLVSIQYPEGLRMVVYPLTMKGDLTEINMLNGYIGMARISPEFFFELRVIAGAFGLIALTTALCAVVRKRWLTLVPLGLMAATAVYGFWRMHERLYQYGHDLDPMAPIDIEPFTPAMFGPNQIAQFATYAWFSWGTVLPIVAGLLVLTVLILDGRARGARRSGADANA